MKTEIDTAIMNIDLISYGIARDIIGQQKYPLNLEVGTNVGELMSKIKSEFPDFNKLTSLLIAINDEYAEADEIIKEGDEVVLIPPVSGG